MSQPFTTQRREMPPLASQSVYRIALSGLDIEMHGRSFDGHVGSHLDVHVYPNASINNFVARKPTPPERRKDNEQ